MDRLFIENRIENLELNIRDIKRRISRYKLSDKTYYKALHYEECLHQMERELADLRTAQSN